MSPRNLDDLSDCHLAVWDLWSEIVKRHGPVITARLFARAALSRQGLREYKNDQLVAAQIKSGLGVRKFAAKLAKKNKSLSRDHRHGPNGSTNAEALEKQIRRRKKAIDQYPEHRRFIERLAKEFPDIS